MLSTLSTITVTASIITMTYCALSRSKVCHEMISVSKALLKIWYVT